MAEKKLSDELRHCLKDDVCGDCQYWKTETKQICEGLLQKAYEAVKRYEEMFPCKVGDSVYFLKNGEILRNYVVQIHIAQVWEQTIFSCYGYCFSIEQLGKTVFLTKEAAEKALKEDRKNGEIDATN